MAKVGVTTGDEELIQRYLNRIRAAGLDPLVLKTPGQSLNDCAGLLLTGGVDISPARYGEEPHPRTQDPDLDRDELEFAVLEEALERDMPILAICRGHQLLNVALGGSLRQHIDDWSHAPLREEGRPSARHFVSMTGILKDIYGIDRLEVNSRHHQAVTPDRLASGLVITSMSEDGYVEGFADPSRRWLVSVQWHPEREEAFIPGFDAESRKLFAAFAEAAGP